MEDRPACISIIDVQHAVARAFCLSISEMLSRKRRHRLTGARQVAMYLSREMAGGGWTGRRRQAAPFPRIGMAFARDHTSGRWGESVVFEDRNNARVQVLQFAKRGINREDDALSFISRERRPVTTTRYVAGHAQQYRP